MSDCEGGELDLLDPVAAPVLARTRMIVEVHDYGDDATIGDTLRGRFRDTHAIETIPVGPRRLEDVPGSVRALLPDEEALLCQSTNSGASGPPAGSTSTPSPRTRAEPKGEVARRSGGVVVVPSRAESGRSGGPAA